MKIVHISTHDNKGGAAIGTYRLHKAFLKYGIDSKMLVKIRMTKEDETIIKAESDSGIGRRIFGFAQNVIGKPQPNLKFGQYSDLDGEYILSNYEELRNADIIYLHWINGKYINVKEIDRILKMGKPVYWMLHDMFPVTGGCHYSLSCEKYAEECQECPFFDDRSEHAYEQMQSKMVLRKYNNLEYIVTSKWLETIAAKSAISTGKKIHRIPYCLNIERFKLVDKEAARKLFNIPNDKKVILFGAQMALYNYYKGFSYFSDALELLSKRNINNEAIVVLVFGSEHNDEITEKIPFEIQFLGHLSDEYSLIMAYNCADVFVMPSLAEAFGQTVIESMACGTPVVGFDVGGIPDNINHKTGYLAKYCDSSDLEQGIYTMLYEKKVDGMLDHVIENNAENVIVQKHIKMWEKNDNFS